MVNAIESAYQFVTNLVLGVIFGIISSVINMVFKTFGVMFDLIPSLEYSESNNIHNFADLLIQISSSSEGVSFAIDDYSFRVNPFKGVETLSVFPEDELFQDFAGGMFGSMILYLASLFMGGNAKMVFTIISLMGVLGTFIYSIKQAKSDLNQAQRNSFAWEILASCANMLLFFVLGMIAGESDDVKNVGYKTFILTILSNTIFKLLCFEEMATETFLFAGNYLENFDGDPNVQPEQQKTVIMSEGSGFLFGMLLSIPAFAIGFKIGMQKNPLDVTPLVFMTILGITSIIAFYSLISVPSEDFVVVIEYLITILIVTWLMIIYCAKNSPPKIPYFGNLWIIP